MQQDVSQNNGGSDTRYFLLFLGLALVAGLCFVFFRVIDPDEGFYLSSASLILQGASPYIDFFFPQMPLLPVFLAPFAEHGLTGLLASRGFALFCHLIMAVIAYYFFRRQFEDRKLALTGFFMIVLSGPIMVFDVMALQYIFANLFFFVAFVLLFESIRRLRVNYLLLFVIFFFLGAAVNIRLIGFIIIPLFFFVSFFIYRVKEGYKFLHFLPAVLFGLIAPSLFSLKLLIQSPDKFFFNNFAFHLLRGGTVTFSDILLNKLEVIGKLLVQPHYLFIIILAIWSQFLLSSFHRKNEFNSLQKMIFQLSLAIGVGFFVIYMIFHPLNTRYFQQSLIYLIIAAVPAVMHLLRRGKKITIALAVVYLLTFLPYPAEYILDIRNMRENFHFNHVNEVSDRIKEYSEPEDTLLSEWVGYNIFADRPQVNSEDFTGFQYDFGNALVPHGRYRLMTSDRVNSILKNQRAKLVVINNKVIPEWRKELSANYNLIDSVGRTYIYERYVN